MQDSQQRQSGERLLLQMGAVAAVIGTVLQVAAGTISSSLPGGDGDAWLRALAEQSSWLLPVIYLGFVFGALLWVWAHPCSPLCSLGLLAPYPKGQLRRLPG